MGPTVFVLVVLVFLGWFALGTQANIRRGNRLLRWLRDGMALLGEKTTLRWLGSSAVELKIQEALRPLRTAEIFVVLEPRDVPLVWWLFRAWGRRDLLILRAQLAVPPAFELEALDPRAWSTRRVARALRSDRWTPVTAAPDSPLVTYTQGGAQRASALLSLATLPELSLVRLGVHRDAPHLEVHWDLTGLAALPSRRVFETLRRLAEGV